MAVATEPESELEVRARIREERLHLAESVDELRSELSEATDVRGQLAGRLQPILPLALAGATGAGFFLGGGIGATVRYFMRRSRSR
jgi:hypothetical protein